MSGALEGKRALVTGAAQGLGAAIVSRLANEGCNVVGWDVNLTNLQKTMTQVGEQTGKKAIARQLDITHEDDVRRHIDEAASSLGGLDVVVCNAGILISGDSIAMSAKDWRSVLEVNLTGYFLTAREAARVMKDRGNAGSIVQINSKSGKKGSYKNCAYAASKFGGIGVTQSLALEFAEHNIRVNSVCPGNLLDSPLWTGTLFRQYAENQGMSQEEVRQKYLDQVPLKRACTYEDVTNLVVFLASDAASYMTGQAINVTGGQEMR